MYTLGTQGFKEWTATEITKILGIIIRTPYSAISHKGSTKSRPISPAAFFVTLASNIDQFSKFFYLYSCTIQQPIICSYSL